MNQDDKWSLPAPGETGKVFKVGGRFDGYCMSAGLDYPTATWNLVYLLAPADCAGSAKRLQWAHQSLWKGGTDLRPAGNTALILGFPNNITGDYSGPELVGNAGPAGWYIRSDYLTPVTPPVTPPVVDAAKSELTVSTGNRDADGIDTHTATATIRDNKGSAMSNQTVTFKIYNEAGTVISTIAKAVPATKDSGTDGKSVVSITATKAGTYAVEAIVGGKSIPGSKTSKVTFVDKAPVAQSSLQVTDGTRLADNWDNHRATATVRDSKGALLKGAEVIFSVHTETGAATSDARVTFPRRDTNIGGIAYTDILATKAGRYLVKATVNGVEITLPGPQYVEFTDPVVQPPVIDHKNSKLEVTPGNRLANGTEKHTATATIRSSTATGSAAIAGADVAFEILNSDGSATTHAKLAQQVVKTGADGTAPTDITATKAGTYMVKATVGGTPIEGSGARFVVFISPTVDLKKSTLEVTPGKMLADGNQAHQATATILSTSATSNAPMADETVSFNVLAQNGSATSDAKITPESKTTDGSGKAVVNITATKAGTYMVEARVGGSEIEGSGERFVEFVDVPTPAALSANHTASATQVMVGEEFTYRVTMRNNGSTPPTLPMLQFKLPAGLEVVRVDGNYMKGSGNAYPGSMPGGQEREILITVKSATAKTYQTQITSVSDAGPPVIPFCTAAGQAACGDKVTVKVVEPLKPTMTCPTEPSIDGIVKLSGGNISANVAKVLVYASKDGESAALLGEAKLAGSGEVRTWSFSNGTPLTAGKYTFTVRTVDTDGKESADSEAKCVLGVVLPVDVRGAKIIDPVAVGSSWAPVGDPANWEITLTEGSTAQVISSGSKAKLVPGKVYSVGERVRVMPAPDANVKAYAPTGRVSCVDAKGAALPGSVFNPMALTLQLDTTGAEPPVAGPIACSVSNQTAHASFVTKPQGQETSLPKSGWSIDFEQSDPNLDVQLNGITTVSELRPENYSLTAQAPAGYVVTGIEMLKLNIPGCATLANDPRSAPEMCWESIGASATSTAAVPQGKHSVYRILGGWSAEVPPLPMTGGLGSWQFLASGASVLLFASAAYWIRSRRLAGGRVG